MTLFSAQQINVISDIIQVEINAVQSQINKFAMLLANMETMTFESNEDFADKIVEHENYLNNNLMDTQFLGELYSLKESVEKNEFNTMTLVTFATMHQENVEKILEDVKYKSIVKDRLSEKGLLTELQETQFKNFGKVSLLRIKKFKQNEATLFELLKKITSTLKEVA